jgi:hypothetical protein
MPALTETLWDCRSSRNGAVQPGFTAELRKAAHAFAVRTRVKGWLHARMVPCANSAHQRIARDAHSPLNMSLITMVERGINPTTRSGDRRVASGPAAIFGRQMPADGWNETAGRTVFIRETWHDFVTGCPATLAAGLLAVNLRDDGDIQDM